MRARIWIDAGGLRSFCGITLMSGTVDLAEEDIKDYDLPREGFSGLSLSLSLLDAPLINKKPRLPLFLEKNKLGSVLYISLSKNPYGRYI